MANDIQRRTDTGSILGAFAYTTVGPIIWALHLGAVYASQMLCATLGTAPAGTLVISGLVGAATIIGLALLAAVLWKARAMARIFGVASHSTRERQFVDRLMRLLAILALAAIAWAGMAAAVLPPCAQLR